MRADRRVVALLALLLGLSACQPGAAPAPAPSPSATEPAAVGAARAFLASYVDPDGRVVRRDQGGDTVSEGQSYGLLLAQVAGDQATFTTIWDWTKQHLQRPDGLFAYLWRDGQVVDPQPASDADLAIAWALLRSPDPGQQAAGRAVAWAVLQHEVASTAGRPLLAAGPWATGSPITLNPSYWAVPAYTALDALDPRWAQLRRSSVATTETLTDSGATLPPDWARVDNGVVQATPAPNGTVPQVRYGLDAQRLVIWYAAACTAAANALAADWWSLLAPTGRATAVALAPGGGVLDSTTNALPLVAAAAAAKAAGEPAQRDRLLAAAAATDRAHPTYYGAAWVALGQALLSTDLLHSCPGGSA